MAAVAAVPALGSRAAPYLEPLTRLRLIRRDVGSISDLAVLSLGRPSQFQDRAAHLERRGSATRLTYTALAGLRASPISRRVLRSAAGQQAPNELETNRLANQTDWPRSGDREWCDAVHMRAHRSM